MELDEILKIYNIYSDSLQKYNNIIWQFPTALITVNILSINFFLKKPYILLFISLVNFIMLHAFRKHIHHQRAIINALRQIENELRKYYNEKMIPKFQTKSEILNYPSTNLLFYMLLAINFVFFCYLFLNILSTGENKMTPEEIPFILNAINTVVIFFTAVFIAWQVRLMQRANKASAFSIIFSTLQSEDIREARKIILNFDKPYSDWDIDLKNNAEKVGHTYDTIGIMLKRGVVPYSFVVEEWHDSIIKCWETTKDMIYEYRDYRGDDFWDDFETLYDKSVEFEKKS